MSVVKETIKQFHAACMKYPKSYAFAALNSSGALFLNIGIPYFSGLALASAASQDESFYTEILLLCIVSFIGVVCNKVLFIALMNLQANVMRDLNQRVFSRTLQRGMQYHSSNIGGKLVSDTLDYVSAYATLAMSALAGGSSFILTLLIGLSVVFIQSWQLGLYLTVVVAVTIIATGYDAVARSRLRTRRLKAQKKLIAHYSDSLVNAATIKAFGRESTEIKKNAELNKKLFNLRLHDWKRAAVSGNYRIIILVASLIGLLIIYNYLIKVDPGIVGVGIFAFTYTFTIILRLFELSTLTRNIEEGFLNADPATRMLMQPVEIEDTPGAPALHVTDGLISFNDASFAYKDDKDETAVFNRLNLQLSPGEKIGLVGPSGGGKSTLTKLLLRFEDITSGSITIDGQDIRDVKQSSLRHTISYVPQEPLLFHRSIGENISYGTEHAVSKAHMIQIAKLAHADEFIEKLPHKFETMVGERGVKLSGGQRQRVAIARAMMKNAPIIVLDEATSALDSESEQLIQDALWKLMENKTTIVIAHRLSTIQKMDRIIVLEDGKITEQGKHSELLKKKNGHYAKLWKHQSGGFLQD